MKVDKDYSAISHIKEYCESIIKAKERFNIALNILENDADYQALIAFYILQIGELVSVLTDEFKNKNNVIHWNKIKALRNIIVHHYGVVEFDMIWEIINTNIPELLEFCDKFLNDD